ncbi:MAG TPA: DUF4129 domain-containing protein [Blastocatellia bacterium]|nr:DUF4129 domain-containing protein [Blastocatellia bacterium]
MPRLIISCLLVLFVGQLALGAAAIRSYEARVHRAAEEVDRIKTDSDYDQEGIPAIRKLVLRYEDVAVNGQTVTVDNTWLYVLLDSLEAEKDRQKQLALLNEAGGRLRALDSQLRSYEEMDRPSEKHDSLDQGGVDAKRDQLRRILDRPEYREKPEDPVAAFIKNLRKRVGAFLVHLFQRMFNAVFGAAGESSWLFRGLIIVVLAAVLVLAARMVTRVKRRPTKKDKKTILGEEIDARISSRELAAAALAAARSGDLRTGVRKLYIALLYQLSEKGLIELQPNATNRDYLGMVSASSLVASPMRYLTERFDYYWYGMLPISDQDYASYVARYEEASSKVGEVEA